MPTPVEDKLYEQWESALLERAMQEQIEDEIRADEAAFDEAEMEQLRAELLEMRPRVNRRIDRALRRHSARQTWRQRLRSGVRAAAAAVAVLAVAFSGFCLASPAIRAQLFQMSAVDYRTHTRIDMDVDWNRLASVPDEWLGHYYPMYIPERLSRVEMGDELFPEADDYAVQFFDPQDENDNVCFEETGYGKENSKTTINVDTEGALVYHETMKGFDVMVIEQDYGITFIWQDGTHILYLSGGPDMEEMKKIFENVERIRN